MIDFRDNLSRYILIFTNMNPQCNKEFRENHRNSLKPPDAKSSLNIRQNVYRMFLCHIKTCNTKRVKIIPTTALMRV